jgi:hypothetical protein
MGFQIKQGRFVARMYYGELARPHGNVLAFFYRDKEAEANEWFFHYRFRYYLDAKIYQSADKRSDDYVYAMEGTFEELEPKVRQILTLMTRAAGSSFPAEVVVNNDDPERIGEILFAQPWAHQEEALSRMNPNPVGIG